MNDEPVCGCPHPARPGVNFDSEISEIDGDRYAQSLLRGSPKSFSSARRCQRHQQRAQTVQT
jgi:hypothetical protein